MKNRKGILSGVSAGMMIVMSFALIIIASFLFSAAFLKATEFTGYFQKVIYAGKTAPAQRVDLIAGAVSSIVFTVSLWKYFLLFGLMGAACYIFKRIDDKKKLFYIFHTFRLSRVYLFWFGVCLVACYLFALLKLRDKIVFGTVFPDTVSVYSFWMLSMGYFGGSLIAARVLKEMWIFWYRLFSNEPKPDESIVFEE
ncbi:MAG: hypothetical protein ABII64_01685 [Elusimicrobiota bacterium]